MVISTSHDWLYCVYMVTTNISIFQMIKNTNYKSKSFFFFRFFKICQKSIIFEINKVSWDSIENSIIRLPTECNGQSKGKYSTSKNHIVFLVSPCFNDRPAEKITATFKFLLFIHLNYIQLYIDLVWLSYFYLSTGTGYSSIDGLFQFWTDRLRFCKKLTALEPKFRIDFECMMMI